MKNVATISSLLSEFFIRYGQKYLDQSSQNLITVSFKRFTDFGGDMKVREITVEEAEIFHTFLVEDKCSKVTANNYLSNIVRVFNWAMDSGKVDTNPFAKVKKFKIAQKSVVVYTVDELRRLFNVSRDDELMQAYIWQGLATLRRGEIMNLTLHDLDFEAKMITIQPKYDTKETWEWFPKNRKIRMIPMVDKVEKILINRINALPSGQPYVNIPAKRYSYLRSRLGVLTERQKKKPLQNFDRTFRRVRQRAYLDGNFHQLRRSGLTMMLEEGEAPHVVQMIAGHSSIKTTQKYIGQKQSYLSGAHITLNRAISSVG